ncbi:LuxR C-terminal-related transcriptional regulator [Nonomuraea typhae]|uniref:LuxR C-terminal-related transcriptional regulator n=1 Tax=Nonomuraea typhae TaxID=2603600 RepID=A0ABW7YSS5_9ACTN
MESSLQAPPKSADFIVMAWAEIMGLKKGVPAERPQIGESIFHEWPPAAAVAHALDGVERTTGQILWIEGGPGTGKTLLLRLADRLARARGFHALYAGADPSAGGERWRLARFLIESLTGGVESWDGSVSSRLESLVLHLPRSKPTAIVIDDLPLADPDSLHLLEFIGSWVHRLPMIMVVAAGLGERAGDPGAFARLAGDSSTRRILLQGLGCPEVEQMITTALGAPHADFLLAVREATGGVPLFVRELLHVAQVAGWEPDAERAEDVRSAHCPAIADTIKIRTKRSTTHGQRFFETLAVLDRADPALIAEVSGLTVPVVTETADRLRDLQILTPGWPVSFAQPVVSTSIYRSIPLNERQWLHGRAAWSLSGRCQSEQVVAGHLLESAAKGEQRTVEVFRHAARQAKAEGAPHSAVRYLQRALQEPPSAETATEVALELAVARLEVDPGLAIRQLKRLYGQTGPPAERARVAVHAAGAFMLADRIDDAVHMLDDAREHLRAPEDGELAAAITGRRELARLLRYGVSPGAGDAVPDAADGVPYIVIVEAMRSGLRGDAHASVALAREVIADQEAFAADETGQLLPAVLPLMWADELADVDAPLRRAARSVHPLAALAARGLAARMALWRGDVGSAVRLGGEVAPVEVHDQSAHLGSGSLGVLALALIEAGDLERAATALKCHERLATSENVLLAGEFAFGKGALAMASGEHHTALTWFDMCGQRLRRAGVRNPVVLPWQAYSAVLRAIVGDQDGAREQAVAALREGQAWGTPRAIGVAARSAGVVACLTGALPDQPEGHRLLEQSVRVLEGSPAILEHMRSLWALGWANRRRNCTAQARKQLREALVLARSTGAAQMATAISEELVASGARNGQSGLGGQRLTHAEHRVATAAADGLTNREIAERIFVTRRTVELHLTSVYRKLGIRGRPELLDALNQTRE